MAKKATKKFKLSTKNKEAIRSAFHTFIAAFIVSITPFIATLDIRNIEQSVIISVALTGVRAGLKALSLYFFPQK